MMMTAKKQGSLVSGRDLRFFVMSAVVLAALFLTDRRGVEHHDSHSHIARHSESAITRASMSATQSNSHASRRPSFAVFVETSAGWVPIADRRSRREAQLLARAASEKSQLYAVVRQGDRVLDEYAPADLVCLSLETVLQDV